MPKRVLKCEAPLPATLSGFVGVRYMLQDVETSEVTSQFVQIAETNFKTPERWIEELCILDPDVIGCPEP